jgi:SAM-dependent methyltransferase
MGLLVEIPAEVARWLAAGALDAVLCIAVLHHISSRARRLRLLSELLRVLRAGGRALITVWASEQEEPGKLQKWEPIRAGASSLTSLAVDAGRFMVDCA